MNFPKDFFTCFCLTSSRYARRSAKFRVESCNGAEVIPEKHRGGFHHQGDRGLPHKNIFQGYVRAFSYQHTTSIEYLSTNGYKQFRTLLRLLTVSRFNRKSGTSSRHQSVHKHTQTHTHTNTHTDSVLLRGQTRPGHGRDVTSCDVTPRHWCGPAQGITDYAAR